MLKHFKKNILGRDFVVGDIHGCFQLFEEKLKEINFNPEVDRMFSVGDLIDRGPESHRALEFLSKPWFHSVRGNHEQMCIDFATGVSSMALHPQNGGRWILNQPDPMEIAKEFLSLPFAIEVETDNGLVGIIHAECPVEDWFELTLHKNNYSAQLACLWSREKIYNNNTDVIKRVHKVFHGHTPLDKIAELGNRVYIDTSAVFTGNLTVVQL